MTTEALSFPVTYYQEHPYQETRQRLAMLTGLPEGVPEEELAEAHIGVLRKALGRGQHISQILVWHPDPPTHDFPLKTQAELMDRLVQREHGTIPIEIQSVVEKPSGIEIVYRVLVTEEQLLEEEERAQHGPPLPGEEKPAEVPMSPVLLAALLSGGFGYFIMPKEHPGARWTVAGIMALLAGTTVAVGIRKNKLAV